MRKNCCSIDDIQMVSVYPYKSCLEPYPSFMKIKGSDYSFFDIMRYTAHKIVPGTWYSTNFMGQESLKKEHKREREKDEIYAIFIVNMGHI